jgi:uncharacterized protein YqjF (DUF2071 family)
VTETTAGACPFRVDRPVMRQQWQRLTFLHWQFEPAVVQRLLPYWLQPDIFEGSAWVGLVPFFMRVATRGGRELMPVSRFCETNVRTYVRDQNGRTGIWFLSLDAASLGAVSVARATYKLPYFWSNMQLTGTDDQVRYRCRRKLPGPRWATSDISIDIGDRYQADELRSRDHFLTARWILFTIFDSKPTLARASHEPWPLHRARVRALDDRLIAAAGLPTPQTPPLVHYSPGVAVAIGRPEPGD